MKKLLLPLTLLLTINLANAQQWQGSSSETNNIYRSGNVGIGTNSPDSKLHIRNDSGNGTFIIQGKQDANIDNFAQIVLSTEYSNGNSQSGSQAGRKTLIRSTAQTAWGNAVRLGFFTSSEYNTYPIERMVITPTGKVGIGTITPDSKLTVKGHIHTQEVKVDLDGAVAPDYVFEENYSLPSLEETEAYIQANKHLPEVPSAAEMEKNGINLKEMNLILLQKIEELTLYTLQQQKELNLLKSENKQIQMLTEKLESLESKIAKF